MKKKFVIGCTVVVLALGIAYGAGTFYYKDKFFRELPLMEWTVEI